jgi:hypothetical protein
MIVTSMIVGTEVERLGLSVMFDVMVNFLKKAKNMP